MFRSSLVLCIVVSLFSACDHKVTPLAPTRAAAQQPVDISSAAGCAVDEDCATGSFCFQGLCGTACHADTDCGAAETCTSRGRCTIAKSAPGQVTVSEADGRVPAAPEVLPELHIVSIQQTVLRVAAGQDSVEAVALLSGDLPASGVEYRVLRSDDPASYQQVHRAYGTDELHVIIPTGTLTARAQADINTPVGAFSVTLAPVQPVEGAYSGAASITAFGSVGLPFELSVVTEPPGASLAEAAHAYVVLPVSDDRLFSPVGASAGVDHVTSELTWDDFTQRWVAVFDHAFDLGTGHVFQPASATQVRRTLRLELTQDSATTLSGALKDSWVGLYEHRSAQGVSTLEPVLFEGTLSLQRSGPAPDAGSVLPPSSSLPVADPQPLPAPPLTDCSASLLAVADVIEGSTTWSCSGIASLGDFADAGAEFQASCAIAVARTGLAGDTTTRQITAFLNGTPPPGYASFADYIAQCATGPSDPNDTNHTCEVAPQVACGRQLLGYAARGLSGASPFSAPVVSAYSDTAREAFFGRQLGAYQNDVTARKAWLQATDYPAIVLSQVKDLTRSNLEAWKTGTLEAQLSVLAGQLDATGLAVLGQEGLSSGDDPRVAVLTDVTQSWRGTLDSLSLGATRWNNLFQDGADRSSSSHYVTARTFDLYLAAGVLKNLNLDAGAGYLSGSLAGGFAELERVAGQLSLSFNKLIYARDGEVVINTSVDPLASNDTILSSRRTDAYAAITSADTSVTAILDQIQAETLNATQLANEMNNQINDLRAQLIEQCGVPIGCSLDEARTLDACRPLTAPGQCGFAVQRGTGEYLAFQALNDAQQANQVAVSSAGQALMDIIAAGQNLQIAQAEDTAEVNRISLMQTELDAFAADVKKWSAQRKTASDQLRASLAQLKASRDQSLNDLVKNIDDRAASRDAYLVDWAADIDTYQQLRMQGVDYQVGTLIAAGALRVTAQATADARDALEWVADATTESVPKGLDDFGAPARMAVKMTEAGVSVGMRITETALNTAADGIDLAREQQSLVQEAQFAYRDELNDLADGQQQADMDALNEQLQVSDKLSENDRANLQDAISAAQQELQMELATERDDAELRSRQTDVKKELENLAALDLRVQQARFAIVQKQQDYLVKAQSAQLTAGRLADLERQRDQVNAIVGSPGAVFSRANKLEQAEHELELAKDKLMNWLVALEYLAVRPFMDQRMQILLASNAKQLQEIADDVQRLEGVCGGAINTTSATVSLRKDLLALTLAAQDDVTDTVSSPEERFRVVLSRGDIPVDKRVRYRVDGTIGSLLATNPDVLAATFNLNFKDFANLDLSCNAKLKSLDIQLVGDLGDARPTVSVLYDGASKLHSCQPGIDDYVALFGPQTTVYGSTTVVRTAGRSVSPTAGLNAFTGTGNTTLGGLPIVSQYTLLIDKSVGENRSLDWSKLTDVLLRVEYTYQDVFPVGKCQ